MNYSEFTAAFKKRVLSLGYEQQLELALSICKKLFFDYVRFHEAHQWGDPDLLMDAIRLCENALDRPADLHEVEEMVAHVDTIIPDMEHFGDELSSYGLNASIAVYETLHFLMDGDAGHVCNIGSYLTDTIDFKIRENECYADDQVLRHPLMVEARSFLLRATTNA